MPEINRPYSILVHHRPARIVFIADSERKSASGDFLKNVDEIFDHNGSVWGGRRNLVFFGPKLALDSDQWSLLQLFDPDVVASFGALDQSQLKAFDRTVGPILIQDLLPMRGTERNLNAWGNLCSVGVPPFPDLIEQLDKNFLSLKPRPLVLFNFSVDCPKAIKRFIHWNFGEFYQNRVGGRTQRVLALERMLAEIPTRYFEISDVHSLADALSYMAGTILTPQKPPLYFTYPLGLCSSFQDAPWSSSYAEAVFTVIIGESSFDIEDFWNGPVWNQCWNDPLSHQLWIPPDLAETPQFLEGLELWLARFTNAGSSHTRSVDYRSRSWSADRLERFAQRFQTGRLRIQYIINSEKFYTAREQIKASSRPGVSARRLGHPSVDTQRLNAIGPHNTFTINLPRILDVTKGYGGWMADIAIEYVSEIEGLFTSESWCRFPRPHCVEIVQQIFKKPARINLDGFPVVQFERRPPIRGTPPSTILTVRLPRHQAIVQSAVCNPQPPVFISADQRHGLKNSRPSIDAQISDKGKHLAAVLTLFNGVHNALGFFGDPYWRQVSHSMVEAKNNPEFVSRLENKLKGLFLKHKVPTTAVPAHFAEELADSFKARVESRSVTLDELVKRAQKSADGNQKTADVTQLRHSLLADLDALVASGIFRLGNRLRCGACGWETWLPIDEIRFNQLCSACGAEIRTHAETPWHYRLNGLVELAIGQGIVPVVRCVGALVHTPGVMFSPSMFLYKDSRAQAWKEIDIALIADGSLVIAEVKKGSLDEKAIKSLCEVGKTICPNRLIAFVAKKPSKGFLKKLEAVVGELSALAVSFEVRVFSPATSEDSGA